MSWEPADEPRGSWELCTHQPAPEDSWWGEASDRDPVKLTRKMKSREGLANPSKRVSSFAHQLLGPEDGKQHETQGGSELCSQRHGAGLSLSPERVSHDSLSAASSPLWNLSSKRLSCLESISVG